MEIKLFKATIGAALISAMFLLTMSGASIADQPRMKAALDALIVAENQLKRGTRSL
ncbi:hypothetical protein MNBD_GAMMA01-1690 [hydrothermal vent metagenome]|uniref:Uncharacterized protein n=1 Tax=hydrothermal vent metagenome TaxID=652676 RepID=A0A3B0V9H5_9ZZZZ